MTDRLSSVAAEYLVRRTMCVGIWKAYIRQSRMDIYRNKSRLHVCVCDVCGVCYSLAHSSAAQTINIYSCLLFSSCTSGIAYMLLCHMMHAPIFPLLFDEQCARRHNCILN